MQKNDDKPTIITSTLACNATFGGVYPSGGKRKLLEHWWQSAVVSVRSSILYAFIWSSNLKVKLVVVLLYSSDIISYIGEGEQYTPENFCNKVHVRVMTC